MGIVADHLVPMHSLEAEMSALGSMLLSERAAEDVVTLLDEGDFYRPAHREVFKAMRQILQTGRPIDIVTIKDELIARDTLGAAGGLDYLVQIMESVPSAANATHYANIVKDKATLRQLEDAGRTIGDIARSPDGDVDEKVNESEQVILGVGSHRLGKDFVPVRTLAKDFFVDVDNIIETGKAIVGLPSGFYDLDEKTTGFYGGDLTIVAARPSMGKTALVLNFALNVARQDAGNVAIFSLEMGAHQLVRRFATMLSGVSSQVLRKATVSHDDYRKLADACETLYGLPMFIDDTSDISAFEMRGKCRRLKQEGGLSLIVVDYLQLMRGHRRSENRVQEISDIVRALKALAKELQVPVIALSQLNRSVENREDKRPQLSDIRESGSIEAEADVVMMIYRDSYYKAKEIDANVTYEPDRVDEAEIIIAKHRNGPTGKVLLGFQASYARFLNLKQ